MPEHAIRTLSPGMHREPVSEIIADEGALKMSNPYPQEGISGAQGTATAVQKQLQQPVSPAEGEEISEEREQRVAELRKQYLDGTYQVDAGSVSASLVEKHLNK